MSRHWRLRPLLSSLPRVHDIGGDPIRFSVALDRGAVALGDPFLFIKKFREDLLKDTFDFKLPGQQLTVGIQPIHFQLMGSDLKRQWTSESRRIKNAWIDQSFGLRIVIDISKSGAYVSADSAKRKDEAFPSFSSEGASTRRLPRESSW